MPVHFRTVELPVPPGPGTAGPGGTKSKVMQGVADFNGPVDRADCALKSFKFDYLGTPADPAVDHQMNVVEVNPIVSSTINDKVHVRVTSGTPTRTSTTPTRALSGS